MTLPSFDPLACAALIPLAYGLHKWSKRSPLPLPPGPKGHFLIGNAFDIPSSAPWLKYHEWSKEFGSDVIHLNMAGTSVIVLDSWTAAWDLMEKRSSMYSDRPRLPLLNEMVGLDFIFALRHYDDQWRSQRKLMHNAFHPAAAERFRPHTLKAARGLLRRLLENSDDIVANIRHMAGETILAIAYGLEVQPENDPYIEIAERSNRSIDEAGKPGAFLVDSFPVLKHVPEWIPGAGFQKKIKQWRGFAQAMFTMPFDAAKSKINTGNFTPSFVSQCFENIKGEDLSRQEYLIQATAATMYAAGSDATISSIGFCIVALLNHPDILKRAQQEIEAVVPFGELPTFDDEEKLPLVTAICMETMRWKDTAPMSLPHRLTEEDTYKGYRLPKGSIVVANAWAMLHDAEVYPDPFSFKPDRFLKDGQINKEIRDPGRAAFGFGRRICPGRYMAFSAVWIAVASLIAAFDITKSMDVNGNLIKVDDEFNEGVLRMPMPFTCSTKPRSEKHERAIRATMDETYEYNL